MESAPGSSNRGSPALYSRHFKAPDMRRSGSPTWLISYWLSSTISRSSRAVPHGPLFCTSSPAASSGRWAAHAKPRALARRKARRSSPRCLHACALGYMGFAFHYTPASTLARRRACWALPRCLQSGTLGAGALQSTLAEHSQPRKYTRLACSLHALRPFQRMARHFNVLSTAHS